MWGGLLEEGRRGEGSNWGGGGGGVDILKLTMGAPISSWCDVWKGRGGGAGMGGVGIKGMGRGGNWGCSERGDEKGGNSTLTRVTPYVEECSTSVGICLRWCATVERAMAAKRVYRHFIVESKRLGMTAIHS